MVAEFGNKKLNRVLVEGNGESLYFALDERNNTFMGMNKMLCSNIIIRFQDGKVDNLSFYVKPEAKFIPPHELKLEDKELKDFAWHQQIRPEKKDVVGRIAPADEDKEEKPALISPPKEANPRKRKGS
jgi:hypothetical protein